MATWGSKSSRAVMTVILSRKVERRMQRSIQATMAPRAEIKVGILGATGESSSSHYQSTGPIRVGVQQGLSADRAGTVGQRFIQLLSTHPYFRLHALGASSRSAGQTYAAATKWKLSTPIPEKVAGMMVLECDPTVKEFGECGVVFSGLDDKVGEIGECNCGRRGVWVSG